MGKEINDYLVNFWKYASLQKYTKLNTEVTKAVWLESTNKWEITMHHRDGTETTEQFTWFISCIGGIHRPKIITIKNDELFEGRKVHTAEWPTDLDLEGKRVALIGSGASAIQVLPELVFSSKCKSVVQCQRTPAYCLMRGQARVKYYQYVYETYYMVV